PPVVLDIWAPGVEGTRPPGQRWTTVAHWTAYGEVQYGGEAYGQKDVEFMRLIELPKLTPYPLEVAVILDDVPVQAFKSRGWHLREALDISLDPWRYREYIWSSRGEFSVAKNAYVKTRCGWFSDRTASYLASGRPAVVQDTGIGDRLPLGSGLLVFGTMEEAAAALRKVEEDYESHCRAALEIARKYFDANKVLNGLLDSCNL
ncbi:MAG: glycosyltransferase, partial [Chloroflexota bacterium]|nr:glycosyltransferase [Chloroflexota bacterium]